MGCLRWFCNQALKALFIFYSFFVTSPSSFATAGDDNCPISCGTKQLNADWTELQVSCKVSSEHCEGVDSYNLDTDFRVAAQEFVDDIGFNATINDDDLMWLRAYGASGEKGHSHGFLFYTNKGGDGGSGGAISLVTSLADYRATYNSDAELYFLLSDKPDKDRYAGGSSVLYSAPFPDPDEELDMQYVLGVAGGGGGGSDGSYLASIGSGTGYSGGHGGIAVSYKKNTCQVASGSNSKGGGKDYQGDSKDECTDHTTLLNKAKKGVNDGLAGWLGAMNCVEAYGGIGGTGGEDDPYYDSIDSMWVNNSDMQNRKIKSGNGGSYYCVLTSGCGGGGGGGFGGGAGGSGQTDAGGGGGSYVAMSTQTDKAANDLTGNDIDYGYLQVIFHLYAEQ